MHKQAFQVLAAIASDITVSISILEDCNELDVDIPALRQYLDELSALIEEDG